MQPSARQRAVGFCVDIVTAGLLFAQSARTVVDLTHEWALWTAIVVGVSAAFALYIVCHRAMREALRDNARTAITTDPQPGPRQ